MLDNLSIHNLSQDVPFFSAGKLVHSHIYSLNNNLNRMSAESLFNWIEQTRKKSERFKL